MHGKTLPNQPCKGLFWQGNTFTYLCFSHGQALIVHLYGQTHLQQMLKSCRQFKTLHTGLSWGHRSLTISLQLWRNWYSFLWRNTYYIMTYKCLNEMSPPYLCSKFFNYAAIHGHLTRNRDLLQIHSTEQPLIKERSHTEPSRFRMSSMPG